MNTIALSQGLVAVVDTGDFEWLSSWNWYANNARSARPYAVRTIVDVRPRTIWMHRELMNAPQGLDVDHINSNTLDNRRNNLRLVTRAQNQHNRRKAGRQTSRFKGVHFRSQERLWAASIGGRFKSERTWLGRFEAEEEAARAYDEVARKRYGIFAALNFPDNSALPSAEIVQRTPLVVLRSAGGKGRYEIEGKCYVQAKRAADVTVALILESQSCPQLQNLQELVARIAKQLEDHGRIGQADRIRNAYTERQLKTFPLFHAGLLSNLG